MPTEGNNNLQAMGNQDDIKIMTKSATGNARNPDLRHKGFQDSSHEHERVAFDKQGRTVLDGRPKHETALRLLVGDEVFVTMDQVYRLILGTVSKPRYKKFKLDDPDLCDMPTKKYPHGRTLNQAVEDLVHDGHQELATLCDWLTQLWHKYECYPRQNNPHYNDNYTHSELLVLSFFDGNDCDRLLCEVRRIDAQLEEAQRVKQDYTQLCMDDARQRSHANFARLVALALVDAGTTPDAFTNPIWPSAMLTALS